MQVKKRIFAGATCDQIVYDVSDNQVRINSKKPRVRFETEDDRRKFNHARGLRQFIRLINNNFSSTSIYSTLTFDNDWEVHTFDEAKKIRNKYRTRLLYKYPDAKIVIVMGRGKGTNRIHFHMLTDGLPEEFLREQWKYGRMIHAEHLKTNVHYNGVGYGQDYSSLAEYLYNHWTEEQGGHHYQKTRNVIRPEAENEGTFCKRTYRPDRPPKAPKGFTFRNVTYNRYGYMCFHYSKAPRAGLKS